MTWSVERNGNTRTISGQRLLVVRLPVSEPVQPVIDRVRALVIVVLPPRVHERLDTLEGGA